MKDFLLKIWVWPFYKTYSGFLFVSLLFGAGLLSGREHIAMANFFVNSPDNLIYPYIAFLVYEFISIKFSLNWLGKPANRLIQELLFLSKKNRISRILLVIFYMQLPVSLYSFFLMIIAVKNGHFSILVLILSLWVIRNTFYVSYINHRIIFPAEKKYISYIKNIIPNWINSSYIMFAVKHILVNKVFILSLTKLVSFLILYICIFLLPTIDIYNRFLSIGISFAFIANTFLPYELFKYHHIQLSFIKNLPLSKYKILVQTGIVLLIFLLPETVFIFKNFIDYISLFNLFIIILSGILILLLMYSILIYYNYNLQDFITRIFWGSLLLVFLFLFDFPTYLFLSLVGFFTLLLFYKGYYKFEAIFN